MAVSSAPISSAPIAALLAGTTGTPTGLSPTLPRDRQVLLVADPWDPRLQRVERVYISSHGYRSPGDGAGVADGIPDHTLFRAGIGGPSSISVSILSGGEISTTGTVGLGEVRIPNVRRRFERLLRLEWNRRPINLYVIQRKWVGPSWSLVRRRVAATVERIRLEDEDLVLVLRDRRSVLEREVNAETYRGLGAAIRFDGSDDEGTLPVEVGNAGSGWLVAEVVMRLQPGAVTANHNILRKRANTGSPNPGWQLDLDFVGLPGGGGVSVLSATVEDTAGKVKQTTGIDATGLDDGELHSYSLVRDPEAGELRVLVDGKVGSVDSAAQIASLSNAQLLRVGAASGPIDLLAGDIGQIRIWQSARSNDELLAWERRPLDTQQKRKTWVYIPCDEGFGSTAFEEGGARRRRGLRLDNSPTGQVDFPSVPDPGTGAFTARFEVYFDEGGLSQHIASKSADISSAGWHLWRATGDQLKFRVHNGTTFFDVSTPSAIETRRVYRVGVRIDPTSSRAELWLNGEFVGSVAYSGSISSATGFRIGQIASGGSQLRGTVFQADLFSAALSPAIMASDEDPDAANASLELWAQFDETSGTTVPDSSAHARDGTISGTGTWVSADLTLSGSPQWVGSLEGALDLAGKRKPRIWGEAREEEGEVVDAQNAVVQFAANPCQSIAPHLDGLASLINDGDSADIYAAAPTAGHYRTDLSRGLARLNALPDGGSNGKVLTANVEGDNTSGYDARGPEIMHRIAIREGGLDDFTEVDSFRFAVAALARPGTVGFVTRREPVTVAAALSELARTSDAFWLIDPRTGKLDIGLRDLPSLQHDHEIDLSKRQVGALRVTEGAPPSSEWRIGYERHGRTLSLDEIAGAASAAQKQALLEAVRLARTGEDTDVVGRFADHEPREYISGYVFATDAEADAWRRQVVDRIPHLVRTFSLIDDGTFYRVGEVALVSGDEYGLDQGLRLVIASVEEEIGGDTVEVGFWGPSTPLDAAWARLGQQDYGGPSRLFWQPTHGLSIGEAVRWQAGTGWVRALADVEENTATGIVAEVLSDEVLLVLMGPAFVVVPSTVLSAFGAGAVVYLSQSVPGALAGAPGSGVSQRLGTKVATNVLRWKRTAAEVI